MPNIGSAFHAATPIHFSRLHFWPYRMFHSRIFSRLYTVIWYRRTCAQAIWVVLHTLPHITVCVITGYRAV